MKRLKTRIDALEAAQNTNSMTGAESMTLVNILARLAALFWPWRFQIGRQTPIPEIRRRQAEYLAGTVGITVKADGKSDWKTAHAMRQSLIASGLITATHASGQVQSVFLTAQGEAIARALVGSRLHTMESGRLVLAVLRQLSAATPVRAVRESILWNRDCVGCPNDWDDSTELILPLLTCGIVRADSDTQGRACYTPVDGIPEPIEIAVSVTADDAFDEFYIAAFNNERAVLEACEPRDPHEICIPLPATGWGWKCHFPEEESK